MRRSWASRNLLRKSLHSIEDEAKVARGEEDDGGNRGSLGLFLPFGVGVDLSGSPSPRPSAMLGIR